MERIRSLIRSRIGTRVLGLTAALAAVALGGAGCQSAAKTRDSMMRAVGLTSKPVPPTQFICMVEPGLQELPDTTRNGQPTKALLGRMYLFGADRLPAEADGQLTLMVSDATPRPAGAPAKKQEVVNIDPKTLKGLVANDERFGRHYVFVFPWPTDWADVTQIEVGARYTPNPDLNVKDMFHQPMRISVSAGGPPPVIDQRTGLPASGPAAMGGVPHPNDFLTGGKPGGILPGGGMPGAAVPAGATFPQQPAGLTPASQPLTPAGGVLPPTTTVGPDGRRVTTSAWVGPPPGEQPPVSTPPQSGFQPTIQPPLGLGSPPLVPQMPAGLPPAVPGGSDPLVWPSPGGVGGGAGAGTGGPPPSDSGLRPVVISRQ